MPKSIILDVPTCLGQAKSQRELVHEEIIKFLWTNRAVFDAPYGTLVKMLQVPAGGFGRTVIFGKNGKFDAMVCVWTPTHIELECRGKPYWRRKVLGKYGKFRGAWELIEHLRKEFRIK